MYFISWVAKISYDILWYTISSEGVKGVDVAMDVKKELNLLFGWHTGSCVRHLFLYIQSALVFSDLNSSDFQFLGQYPGFGQLSNAAVCLESDNFDRWVALAAEDAGDT